jgi:signal transduction histidine kinase
MIRRPTLRFYLAVSYSLFVLIVVGGLNLYWFSQQEQVAEGALRDQLKERARLIATAFESDQLIGGDFILPAVDTAIYTNLRTFYVTPELYMRSLSDDVLDDKQQAVMLDLAQNALSGQAVSREIYNEDFSRESLYAAAPVYNADGHIIGLVCVLLPLDAFEASIARARTTTVLFSIIVAVLSTPLGLALAEILTRRLSQAQRLAARVASGDYSLRMSESGPRELADLAVHLNTMADELEQQTRMRNLALARVTHELARPLGGLKLGVQSMQAGAMKDPVLADDLLDEMGQSLKRMEAMVEDLTLAGRPTNKYLALNLEPIQLNHFLRQQDAIFRRRASERDITLQINLPHESLTVSADELRLSQIIGNLVANALKYTPAGGQVILCAAASNAEVRISVRDTGPGIPEEDLPLIFEPFFQGRNANPAQQGMGLGLTIAQQLAVAHGGRIEVARRESVGLRASVILPLNNNHVN